jgi:hypothetical protein
MCGEIFFAETPAASQDAAYGLELRPTPAPLSEGEVEAGAKVEPVIAMATMSPGVAAKKKKKKKKSGLAAIDPRTRKLLAGVAGAAVALSLVLGLWLSGVFDRSVTLDEVVGTYVSDQHPKRHEISVLPDGTCALSKSEEGSLSVDFAYDLALDGSRLKLDIPEAYRERRKLHLERVKGRGAAAMSVPTFVEVMLEEFGKLTYRDDYILSSKLGRFSRVKNAAVPGSADDGAHPAQDTTAIPSLNDAAVPVQEDNSVPTSASPAVPDSEPDAPSS